MPSWIPNAVFYHIYPLGACGTPENNDFQLNPVNRLNSLYSVLDHIQELGANALYLGPVFESTSHGYDTADYFTVDRRLGDHQSLAEFCKELNRRGMRIVFDAVFNHVGRDFWAFKDVLEKQEKSAYCNWFHNLQFGGSSPYGDAFTYEGWQGHLSLVKLNLANSEVQSHIFDAVRMWQEEFKIDGLRLDAADCLDMGFIKKLSAFCRTLSVDFWLMGEVTAGDYTQWANPPLRLDSVTNYECYKGLYSSHVDKNYFEIAYSFNRLFAKDGLCKHLNLYNFVDNHDVNRAASSLSDPGHLSTMYTLLFTMPGIPSIYYGSEWGLEGKKSPTSDRDLRPLLDLDWMHRNGTHPNLCGLIASLAEVRQKLPALRMGSYQQLWVAHEQFVFMRPWEDQPVIVAVNMDEQPKMVKIPLDAVGAGKWVDELDPGYEAENGVGTFELTLPAHGQRILVRKTK